MGISSMAKMQGIRDQKAKNARRKPRPCLICKAPSLKSQSRCSKHYRVLMRLKRQKKWESGIKPSCIHHPERTVNRAQWVRTGQRVCGSCVGRLRPSNIKSELSRRKARRDCGLHNLCMKGIRLRRKIESIRI